MINVIASVHIKEGKLSDYLGILKAGVPLVRKEKGCVEYVPTGDSRQDCRCRSWTKMS